MARMRAQDNISPDRAIKMPKPSKSNGREEDFLDFDELDDWDDSAEVGRIATYMGKLNRANQQRNAQARRRLEMLREERQLRKLLEDDFAF